MFENNVSSNTQKHLFKGLTHVNKNANMSKAYEDGSPGKNGRKTKERWTSHKIHYKYPLSNLSGQLKYWKIW